MCITFHQSNKHPAVKFVQQYVNFQKLRNSYTTIGHIKITSVIMIISGLLQGTWKTRKEEIKQKLKKLEIKKAKMLVHRFKILYLSLFRIFLGDLGRQYFAWLDERSSSLSSSFYCSLHMHTMKESKSDKGKAKRRNEMRLIKMKE